VIRGQKGCLKRGEIVTDKLRNFLKVALTVKFLAGHSSYSQKKNVHILSFSLQFTQVLNTLRALRVLLGVSCILGVQTYQAPGCGERKSSNRSSSSESARLIGMCTSLEAAVRYQ